MSGVINIQGSIIATWALALVSVCLRFIARRLSKAGFWYDDWLIVPATVSILRSIVVTILVAEDNKSKLIHIPDLHYGAMLCLRYLE